MGVPPNHHKSFLQMGFSIINQPFLGYPHDYGNPLVMVFISGYRGSLATVTTVAPSFQASSGSTCDPSLLSEEYFWAG